MKYRFVANKVKQQLMKLSSHSLQDTIDVCTV